MTTLLTLLSVALGGVIGLAGSWLIEWMKEKNERKKKRAEKLEELVSAVYEFDHWLDRYRSINTYGNPGEAGLSPMFLRFRQSRRSTSPNCWNEYRISIQPPAAT